MDFNFDEWSDLYRTDPAEFEERRKAIISEAINSAPASMQLKLHQLQWKIDAIRTTNTPIGGLLKIQEMMWDSFLNMNDQFNALMHATSSPPPTKLTLVK